MFAKDKESEFFLKNINKNSIVLEYGSGESTIEIANLCKSVLSIEHNPKWYSIIKSQLPSNATIILKESNLPYIDGHADGTYQEFKDYIEAPLGYGKFDIILIDGRARLECAKFIKNVCHKNTIIFVHDFTSRVNNLQITPYYKDIFNYLDILESVQDMSKFKLKV